MRLIKINDKHQPKGSMCLACKYLKNDCSNLDFPSYKPISTDSVKANNKYIVVICEEFSRQLH